MTEVIEKTLASPETAEWTTAVAVGLKPLVSIVRFLPILKKCVVCGSEFFTKKHLTHQKYCSAECRNYKIPNKCLLCGITLNRGKKYCSNCAKSIHRIQALINYYNNTERQKISQKNWRKRNPGKFKHIWKKYQKNYKKEEVKSLSNNYIKSLLCNESKYILNHSNIPQELIEAKRQYMKTNRKLKEANNGI